MAWYDVIPKQDSDEGVSTYDGPAELLGQDNKALDVRVYLEKDQRVAVSATTQDRSAQANSWEGLVSGLSRSQLVAMRALAGGLKLRLPNGNEGAVLVTGIDLEADPPVGILTGSCRQGPPF